MKIAYLNKKIALIGKEFVVNILRIWNELKIHLAIFKN
jgi:hypothetical protein